MCILQPKPQPSLRGSFYFDRVQVVRRPDSETAICPSIMMPVVSRETVRSWKNLPIPCFMIMGIRWKRQPVSIDEELASIRTFQHLRLLLSQDDDGLARYVYPCLTLGDIWWIPDEVTGFADKQRHPWVVLQGFSNRRTTIVACPRTTSTKNHRDGILMPAGLVPGLDRPGLIMLRHRRSFTARMFREFEYVGRLPDDFIKRIREYQSTVAKGKTTR
jgi:mRNA-degrading endonuclease toxin of MazEF toxin-antitoxin module